METIKNISTQEFINRITVILKKGYITVRELELIVPKGTNDIAKKGNFEEIHKFRFKLQDGEKIEVKWHSQDYKAGIKHPGCISSKVWTAQIKIGQDKYVKLRKDGIVSVVKRTENRTHIPVKR